MATCTVTQAAGGLQAAPSADLPDMAAVAALYPTDSIRSVVMADAALREIKRQRSLIDAQYSKQEEACLPTFFTNNCLDNARERRRLSLALIRPIELEANAFKRRARVEERDRELATKQLKPQKDAGNDAPTDMAQDGSVNGRRGQELVRREAPALRPTKAPVSKSQDLNAADEQRRTAAYDKKLADSLKRQKAVAARKAAAEQKRSRKLDVTPPVSQPSPAS
ncbi:MAG: hypothetical protein V4695_04305 [Pseudomonadota bacterium]